MTWTPPRRHALEGVTISPAMEDYLKSIFVLNKDRESASTQAVSERMKVSPASATKMIKRLADAKLVLYEPYQGVRLSEAGRKVAVETLRHHRLLELYLMQALGYTWDEVHEEAEVLEHFISEKLEARICEALGNPTFDPHGSPIPTLDGELPRVPLNLSQAHLLEEYEVVGVEERDSMTQKEISEAGFFLGMSIMVLGRPLQGKTHLKIGRREILLDRELCELVSCQTASHECFLASDLEIEETAEVVSVRGPRTSTSTGQRVLEGETLRRNGEGSIATSQGVPVSAAEAEMILVKGLSFEL